MEDSVALLIPIFGIVFGILVAIVAIVTQHRQKIQRADLRHKERLATIDKGLELPPDTEDAEDVGKRSNSLRSGLTGIAVGVVLYFALDELVGSRFALFGLIPAAVGVANLLFYIIEGRRKSNGNGSAIGK